MTWIQTRTDGAYDFLRPDQSEIRIEDIAYGLAGEPRFAAQAPVYVVAQHSVLAVRLVEAWGGSLIERRWALMHDAAEAYVKDLPAPLKRLPELAGYRRIEDIAMRAICDTFGLVGYKKPPIVGRADDVLLDLERQALFGAPPRPWVVAEVRDIRMEIVPWGHKEARLRFLAEFYRLFGGER